jgi:quercetin dioxygenase-like cupin family protein
MNPAERRFVPTVDAIRETSAWTKSEWLCRPDLVAADKLLMVRATMDPFHSHPFHQHPHREEIIYIIAGRAEQWVGPEYRILVAGDTAHIPAGMVHATYNPHPEPLVFLAILSPAQLPADLAAAPDPYDVSTQAPWSGLRKSLLPCGTRE